MVEKVTMERVAYKCNTIQLNQIAPMTYELRIGDIYACTLTISNLFNLQEILNDIFHKSEETPIQQ